MTTHSNEHSADGTANALRSALLTDLINDPSNDTLRSCLREFMEEKDIANVLEGDALLRKELQMLDQLDQVPVPEITIPRLNPRRVRIYKSAPFVGVAVLILGLIALEDRIALGYHNAQHLGNSALAEAHALFSGTPMLFLLLGLAGIAAAAYVMQED